MHQLPRAYMYYCAGLFLLLCDAIFLLGPGSLSSTHRYLKLLDIFVPTALARWYAFVLWLATSTSRGIGLSLSCMLPTENRYWEREQNKKKAFDRTPWADIFACTYWPSYSLYVFVLWPAASTLRGFGRSFSGMRLPTENRCWKREHIRPSNPVSAWLPDTCCCPFKM